MITKHVRHSVVGAVVGLMPVVLLTGGCCPPNAARSASSPPVVAWSGAEPRRVELATKEPAGCTLFLARDGHIEVQGDVNNDHAVLCFRQPKNPKSAPDLSWPSEFVVGVTAAGQKSLSLSHQNVDSHIHLGATQEAGVLVEIRDQAERRPLSSDLDGPFEEMLNDAAFGAELEAACPGEPLRYLRAHRDNVFVSMWGDSRFQPLLFSGALPTSTTNRIQRIQVDASWQDSNTSIDVQDGERIQAWAYNVSTDASQRLVIRQGDRVVQASSVGPLLLSAFGATGSPFPVPSLSTSAAAAAPATPPPTVAPVASVPAQHSAPSAAEDAAGRAATDALHATANGTTDESDAAARAAKAVDNALGSCAAIDQLAKKELSKRLRTTLSSPLSKYTAIAAYATLPGNYHYSIEVIDANPTQKTDATKGSTAPNELPATAATRATTEFKSHVAHRVWSVGVEESFNTGGASLSGYSYVPVAQTGTDQEYQLRSQSHAADQFTASASLLLYPASLVTDNSACVHEQRFSWLCVTRIGLSFGPTFLRGGNAEVFKQWNARLVYEIVPDILLTVGPSWRTYDVPLDVPIGTLVSVPRPATTPTFPTTSTTDTVWSVGLAVDLAIVTDGISAISNAVSPSKGASK